MSNHGVLITQQELQEIYELRRRIAQDAERCEHLEEGVMALLIAKMEVELGRYDAELVWRHMHHPAWRQAVEDNLGHEWAENFRKNSPSNPVPCLKVEEHATLPLWKGRGSAAEDKRKDGPEDENNE